MEAAANWLTETMATNWNMAKAAWVARTAGVGEEAVEVVVNWEVESLAS